MSRRRSLTSLDRGDGNPILDALDRRRRHPDPDADTRELAAVLRTEHGRAATLLEIVRGTR